jgi:Flp pilus assembly protein TadB
VLAVSRERIGVQSGRLRVVGDSRTIRFVESQEEKRKPHPGLYTFVAVLWGAIAVTTLVGFIVFRSENGGDDWSLLILAIGGTVVVPLMVWRIKRDRRRQATWVKPVKL